MRVTQHNGRVGNAGHNDRSFLAGKSADEKRETAPHISPEKEHLNRFVCIYPDMDFKTAEKNFYMEHYGRAVEATNERYRHHGHPERCRSTDDLYAGRQTRPEEVIMQIGDKDAHISKKAFMRCLNDFLKRLDDWNREHGEHMHILNIALHMDETSPHVHIRRVWDYTDKEGLTRLGQNKALEQAGIPLPDESKASSRYNNRKMTFDKMTREMWQDVCREHGFDIETEPRPSVRHKAKAEYIAERLSEAQKTIEQAEVKESRLNALEARIRRLIDSEGYSVPLAQQKSINEEIRRIEQDLRLEEYANLEQLYPEQFRMMREHSLQRERER